MDGKAIVSARKELPQTSVNSQLRCPMLVHSGAWLGDKRVVLIGLVLMISGGLMALMPEWSMQIAGRLLAGIGGILLNVLMTKMAADWFPGRELSTAMAILGNAAAIRYCIARGQRAKRRPHRDTVRRAHAGQ